ncbi:hypothetical protein BV898_08304 [Hypsibius exemplaris]|uniref:Uncharacterized protein n=1 Tax=Hypsibius exemplaris TaxID=2072580 RepID=A0A1W0WR77_HYPEX|nr:hypothetical protein BV898_08304 [Hypsibius exemplaris]
MADKFWSHPNDEEASTSGGRESAQSDPQTSPATARDMQNQTGTGFSVAERLKARQAIQQDREERRKYLESREVLDFITKAVMQVDTTGRMQPAKGLTLMDVVQLKEFDPEETEIVIMQKELAVEKDITEKLLSEIAALEARLHSAKKPKKVGPIGSHLPHAGGSLDVHPYFC